MSGKGLTLTVPELSRYLSERLQSFIIKGVAYNVNTKLFGRHINIIKRSTELARRKKKHGVLHALGIIFKLLIAVILLMVLIVAGFLYLKYGDRVLAMRNDAILTVEASSPSTFRQTETGLIYDANGQIIDKLIGSKDVYYISYKDIPKDAINAVVSIEDKKFFTHKGYDPYAILRAAYAYIRNKGAITQGGSTITQQLAKNIFLSFDETWERKAREIFISMELEKKYSKQQILEFYLNNIYFANGNYGIQSASFGYFGKGVSELSLSQCAFLVGIPNSPNRYDPYEHLDAAVGRRDRILDQMELDGKITAEECADAKNEDIELVSRKNKESSYMVTYANDCAVKALMKADGFNFKYGFDSDAERDEYEELYNNEYSSCQMKLYTGGYRIYTSLEPTLQKKLQKTVDDKLSESKSKSKSGVYKLQGSAVTIDNDTGRVVAIVGGRSQRFQGQSLNRAYQSFRQPGSSIKPLIVYTPAFEKGYTPESIVKDEKIKGGPQNAEGWFRGNMKIRNAVAVSVNTVAWKLFTEISPAAGLQKLLDMDFSNITSDDYYPAAALGGLTHGVSSLEMTSGFAAIENNGMFRDPSCIVKITDADGNNVITDTYYGGEDEKPVYDETAVKMMTSCLEDVMKTGTGRTGILTSMPCAGKTGTTNNAHDLWFVGFTHYYTTGVWVGYDMPASLNSLSMDARPLAIWKSFMEDIHTGLKNVKLDDDYGGKKTEKKEEPASELAVEDNEPEAVTEEAIETAPEITPEQGNEVTQEDNSPYNPDVTDQTETDEESEEGTGGETAEESKEETEEEPEEDEFDEGDQLPDENDIGEEDIVGEETETDEGDEDNTLDETTE